MEIKLTTGCTVDSLMIDGEIFESLSLEEVKHTIIVLLNSIIDKDLCNEIIRDIVYTMGEYKDGYRCDQCGDFVETYELKV